MTACIQGLLVGILLPMVGIPVLASWPGWTYRKSYMLVLQALLCLICAALFGEALAGFISGE